MGNANVRLYKKFSTPLLLLRWLKYIVQDCVCIAHLLGISSFPLCVVTLSWCNPATKWGQLSPVSTAKECLACELS